MFLLYLIYRLYTQLEYLKNKTLRHDNPHISKRRGGRKVAHRRFSLQVKFKAFHYLIIENIFTYRIHSLNILIYYLHQ